MLLWLLCERGGRAGQSGDVGGRKSSIHHFHLCSPAVWRFEFTSSKNCRLNPDWDPPPSAGADAAEALNISRHESGGADGNVAHHSGSSGLSKEERLGSGGFPADVAAGRSGAVPAAGAAPTRDGGQSEWRCSSCSSCSRCSQMWSCRHLGLLHYHGKPRRRQITAHSCWIYYLDFRKNVKTQQKWLKKTLINL